MYQTGTSMANNEPARQRQRSEGAKMKRIRNHTSLPVDAFLDSLSLLDEPIEQSSADGINYVLHSISDPYTGHTQNVIIRDADLRFWTYCFEQLERDDELNRVCVVGTPGIGKSTTSFFAIRNLLLEQKKVVYWKRSSAGTRDYIVLVPTGDPINPVEYNIIPGETPINKIPFLHSCETYFMVDPGDTTDSCDPPGEVKAKVIIVASPNENHWGGSAFEKRNESKEGGFFLYFPPWSLAELIAGASELERLAPAHLTQTHIKEAFGIFGGVPRQVFDAPSRLGRNKTTLRRKIDAIPEADLKRIVARNVNIHANFGDDQPKGGIIIFWPVDDFSDIELELASEFVSDVIRRHFMTGLWTELVLYPTPISWQLLESYTASALLSTNEYTVRNCVSKNNPMYQQTRRLDLGGCDGKSFQADCTSAVLTGTERTLYYSSNRTHPLYDMIYKIGNVYYAFQVTVARSHSAKAGAIRTLVSAMGIGTGGCELRLFYAVHAGVFDDFVTDPVEPVPTRAGLSIYHLKIPQALT